MKLVFWVVVILAIMLVARLLAARSAAREREDRPTPPPAAPGRRAQAPAPDSEPMVRCAHCGIHLPRSEALLQGGLTWCGPEHARLGARALDRI